MEFKIFVSYSTNDLQQAKLLEKQLVNTPIKVFIAERTLKLGDSMSDTLTNEIISCDLFVVLWGGNAKKSEWVSQEIGLAHGHKKAILPLILDKKTLLPGFIRDLKYTRIYENSDNILKDVSDTIIEKYNEKLSLFKEKEASKQKDKEILLTMGVGAFLLWVIMNK